MCPKLGHKKRSDQILAEEAGQSRNQVQRYIRLTELIPPLLDLVDQRKIAFNPAYELSFLKPQEQLELLDAWTVNRPRRLSPKPSV